MQQSQELELKLNIAKTEKDKLAEEVETLSAKIDQETIAKEASEAEVKSLKVQLEEANKVRIF